MAHPPDARKATVTALIMNQLSPWEETDRAMLEGLPDEKLQHLVTLCTPVTATAQPGTPVAQTPQVPATLAAAIAQMPEEFRGVLTTLHREHETRRTSAIQTLTTHGCTLRAATLAAMELEELESLVAALQTQADGSAGADYAALGLPHVRQQGSDTAPPPPPDTFAEALKIRQQQAGVAVA